MTAVEGCAEKNFVISYDQDPLSKPADELTESKKDQSLVCHQNAGLFSKLPEKVILKILSLLTLEAVARVGRTCKMLGHLTQDNQLWKKLYVRDLSSKEKLEEVENWRGFYQKSLNYSLIPPPGDRGVFSIDPEHDWKAATPLSDEEKATMRALYIDYLARKRVEAATTGGFWQATPKSENFYFVSDSGFQPIVPKSNLYIAPGSGFQPVVPGGTNLFPWEPALPN